MRLSIKKTDPGYREPHELKKFKIFFNGAELFNVHTADEEAGYIQKCAFNRPAPWLPVRTTVGARIHGKVEIKHA